jgi:hypothetical protein
MSVLNSFVDEGVRGERMKKQSDAVEGLSVGKVIESSAATLAVQAWIPRESIGVSGT